MSDLNPILPDNAKTFARALAYAMSDELPIPYAQILDPYQTPVAFLPWLAAHHSVDLWYDDWTEDHKREVIAQAAGRSVLYTGRIADLKTTRTGTIRYLEQVSGTVLHVVSYPQRVIAGRTAIRRWPVGHPAFKARHLVKVETTKPPRAWVAGRTPAGRLLIKTPSREPLRRCMKAMRVAKGINTEYRVDFAHKRVITIDDTLE